MPIRLMPWVLLLLLSVISGRCSGNPTSFTYSETERIILKQIPKIELHAHLHGSIRRETLIELAHFQNLGSLRFEGELDIDHCFTLFSILHKVISTAPILKRVLREVLADYMEENTVYLELRTTPRSLSDGTSAEEYVQIVATMIQQHNIAHGEDMLVKLILSVDRSKRYSDAAAIVAMATDNQYAQHDQQNNLSKTIVGLDFSGNPQGGRFEDFRNLFLNAREQGLGITVHTAELPELSDSLSDTTDADSATDETTAILKFRPERVGHALYLQPHHLNQLDESRSDSRGSIAVEICPSSNLLTLGLSTHAERPFIKHFWDTNYPISINTDDRGIFNTTLTEELLHVMYAMQLEISDMVYLQSLTIHQTFTTAAEKAHLKDIFWGKIDALVVSNAEVILLNREEAERAAAAAADSSKERKAIQDQTDLLNMWTSF